MQQETQSEHYTDIIILILRAEGDYDRLANRIKGYNEQRGRKIEEPGIYVILRAAVRAMVEKTQDMPKLLPLPPASLLMNLIEPVVADKMAFMEFEVRTQVVYGNDNDSIFETGNRREINRIKDIIRSFSGIESEAVQEHICAMVRHIAEAVGG